MPTWCLVLPTVLAAPGPAAVLLVSLPSPDLDGPAVELFPTPSLAPPASPAPSRTLLCTPSPPFSSPLSGLLRRLWLALHVRAMPTWCLVLPTVLTAPGPAAVLLVSLPSPDLDGPAVELFPMPSLPATPPSALCSPPSPLACSLLLLLRPSPAPCSASLPPPVRGSRSPLVCLRPWQLRALLLFCWFLCYPLQTSTVQLWSSPPCLFQPVTLVPMPALLLMLLLFPPLALHLVLLLLRLPLVVLLVVHPVLRCWFPLWLCLCARRLASGKWDGS